MELMTTLMGVVNKLSAKLFQTKDYLAVLYPEQSKQMDQATYFWEF